jgi:enoyl-CoA hydratase
VGAVVSREGGATGSREPRLLTEQDGPVLVVRFTNPPRNFFDERTSFELRALVKRIEKNASIGAVVFTGQDLYVTHYSVPDILAGSRKAPFHVPYRLARLDMPLVRLLQRIGPIDRALSRTRLANVMATARTYDTFHRMNSSAKVYIAAINGLAFGMGAVLALACDLRFMAGGEHAVFGFIEPGISMLAGAGGTQRLTRMVGQSRALEMLLEGGWITADDAAELGIVHKVVSSPDEVLETAVAAGRRLAARSRELNREIKRMIYDAGTRSLTRGMRMEAASLVSTVTTRRAAMDCEGYLRELAKKHDPPTDADVMAAWTTMLDTGPRPQDARLV